MAANDYNFLTPRMRLSSMRIPPSRRLHIAVTLGAALLFVAPISAAPNSAGTRDSVAPAIPAPGTRFSATLRGEPLPRLLSLIENTTPVRFRYGAPMDVSVTDNFDNAPLWPSLEALLLKSGFQMRRSRESVFLFRNATAAGPTAAVVRSSRSQRGTASNKGAVVTVVPDAAMVVAPATWQYWALTSPPPAGWMMVQPAPRLPVVVPHTDFSHGWRKLEVSITAEKSPGVAVALPANTALRYLRWPMKLRDNLRSTQLLIETSAPATLYVNGALMFRRRSGRQLLDLSDILRIGDNCIALQWESLPPPSTPNGVGAAPATSPVPTLYYEWFFSQRNH